MEQLIQMIRGKDLRIMFTEGWDARVIQAAIRLCKDGILHPILNGPRDKILAEANALGESIEDIEIMDKQEYPRMDDMILRMVELRKGKLSALECCDLLDEPNYFATMCLAMDDVDGVVGGATISTRDTLRAALQLIKTKQGCEIVSSSFVMTRGEERYIMGDCSLNIDPTIDQLVDIAIQCAKTAKVFGIDPKVGLLSYSSFGSGSGSSVDKMKEAVKRLKRLPLPYEVDGEMQVDMAVAKDVAALKAPDCVIGGSINTFIFPTLDAGNIGYKLVARFGGFEAVGPILQGMNKPLNDLSRGANIEEVYKMAIVTAAQKLMDDATY